MRHEEDQPKHEKRHKLAFFIGKYKSILRETIKLPQNHYPIELYTLELSCSLISQVKIIGVYVQCYKTVYTAGLISVTLLCMSQRASTLTEAISFGTKVLRIAGYKKRR